jgi:anti-anti-sigma factor
VAPPALVPPRTRPALEVVIQDTPTETIVRLKGEASMLTAGALEAGLLPVISRRPAVVTFDLSDLRSISSLAMGILVRCRRVVVRAGQARLAPTLRPEIAEALASAGVMDLFGGCSAREPALNTCP